MENLAWTIYWIDIITQGFDGLGFILFATMLTSSFALIVKAVASTGNTKGDVDTVTTLGKLPLKTLIIVPLILLTLSNFIPTKQTAYTMLVAHGASEVMATEEAKEVMGSSLELLNMTIEKYKKELKED